MEWDQPIDSGPIPASGNHYDVIVVGGGPGGSASASYMAMAGHRVLLLEKAVWPRDKTCGDAVGGKSLKHVEEIGLKTTLEETNHFRVDGIVFSSPNGTEVRISLPEDEVENREAGYSLPRRQFDTLMFRNATGQTRDAGGDVIQDFTVTEVHLEDGKITGVSGIVGGKRSGNETLTFTAPLTIGAGGYNCPVARTITEAHDEPMVDKDHYCGAYREYWTGVGGCEDWKGAIEIHFIDGVIPGYFWIFPVGDGIVNVGIGMVITEMDKQKVKLRGLQDWVIREHPKFSKRFENATMVEGSGKGWQLPFGSPRKNPPSFQPRRSAMRGGICVGDAASLVDPFTGEGIGNALLSAKLASEVFGAGNYSEEFTEEGAVEYQNRLWDELSPELTNSFKLQRLVKKKRLMNFFIGKASRKIEIQRALTDMIASKEAQGQFHSKWWLIKTLLF
ncbi:MAG: geranylgeranyl reductase family protein [Candidatus Thermoplasmatota archaeon]|nr:geranylgeranyl reductase family protein [Candidatus Thermoplasmatota archaeon]